MNESLFENDLAIQSVRKNLFLAFCSALENANISYVILSGYDDYPDTIGSDVDFMISKASFHKLPALLLQSSLFLNARLLQFIQHEFTACYFCLAKVVDSRIAFLHPDATTDFRLSGRLWLRSEQVLATRRRHAHGFWIPTAKNEFEYYFIKRIDKESLTNSHVARFKRLFEEDSEGCRAVLMRLLNEKLSAEVINALESNDLDALLQMTRLLHQTLLASAKVESFVQQLLSFWAEAKRKVVRIIRPTGLIIAVLGADGSGKTTIIEHLARELAPGFRHVRRFHLRPHFGRVGSTTIVSTPHAEPPRSRLMSFIKLLWFALDYWLGYLRLIYPAKIRSTLIIFDRYFHDMIVDPKRYRLSTGCFKLLQFFTRLAPQPDIWLVLDTPAPLLVSRKGELDLKTALALTNGYRELATTLLHSHSLDTSDDLETTLAKAVELIVYAMAQRTYARLGQDQRWR